MTMAERIVGLGFGFGNYLRYQRMLSLDGSLGTGTVLRRVVHKALIAVHKILVYCSYLKWKPSWILVILC